MGDISLQGASPWRLQSPGVSLHSAVQWEGWHRGQSRTGAFIGHIITHRREGGQRGDTTLKNKTKIRNISSGNSRDGSHVH